MEYDVQRNIEEILELKVGKYLGVFQISSLQTSYKKMEDCTRKGKIHPASEAVKNKLLEQIETNKKLQDGVNTFVKDNPQFSKILEPLLSIDIEAI